MRKINNQVFFARNSVSRHLLEGEHLEAVYDDAANIKARYLRGAIIDEVVNGYLYDESGNKTNYTFHHDNLRSVTGLSGHDGTTLETTEYGPFGNEVASAGISDNTLKYTGRELDATGLYYYRARYYDPEAGRFLTEDPKGFDAGVNFYAYVLNNPINLNDPMGLDVYDVCANPQDCMETTDGNQTNLAKQEYYNGLENNPDINDPIVIYENPQEWRQSTEPYLHRNGSGNENNIKFIGPNGAEIVINPNTNEVVTDPTNRGTWNRYDEKTETIAHGIYDAGNYILYGTGPDDTSSVGGRIYNTVIGTDRSVVGKWNNYVDDKFFGGSSSTNNASGGFVLYPNKANNNILVKVYRK